MVAICCKEVVLENGDLHQIEILPTVTYFIHLSIILRKSGKKVCHLHLCRIALSGLGVLRRDFDINVRQEPPKVESPGKINASKASSSTRGVFTGNSKTIVGVFSKAVAEFEGLCQFEGVTFNRKGIFQVFPIATAIFVLHPMLVFTDIVQSAVFEGYLTSQINWGLVMLSADGRSLWTGTTAIFLQTPTLCRKPFFRPAGL